MPYEDLEKLESEFPKQEINHHVRNYLLAVKGLLKNLDRSVSDSTNIDDVLEKALRDLNRIKHRTKGIVIGLNYIRKYRNTQDIESKRSSSG